MAYTLVDDVAPAAPLPGGGYTFIEPSDAPPVDNTAGMSGTDKFAAGIGKGFSDLPNSVEQIARLAQLAFTGDMTALARLKQLQEQQKAKSGGTDKQLEDAWQGAVGSMVPSLLATLPMGGAAPIAAGATQGLLTPSTSPGESAFNAVTGGLGGKLADVAGKGLAKGATNVWQWLTDTAPDVGKLIPDAVKARIDAIRQVTGDDGSMAQITGDPGEWARWVEAGKGGGKPGEAYLAARRAQGNSMQAFLDAMGKNTGKTGYGAGEDLLDAAKSWASDSQGEVGQLYTLARNTFGAGKEVPMQPIADELGKIVDKFGDASDIPGRITSRLQAYGLLGGKQTKAFTVADSENLRQVIGANINWTNKPQAAQLLSLQNAIDEATGGLADVAGGDAAAALQTARAAARDRFAQMKPSIMGTLLKSDELNPNFIATKIMGGKPQEIAATRATLTARETGDTSVWDGVHDAVLDQLQKAATVADSGFNGKLFGRALDKLGPERLNAIFDPMTVAKLNTLRTASEALTTVPEHAPINTSGTAAKLLESLKTGHGAELLGAVTGTLIPHGFPGGPTTGALIGAGVGAAGQGFAKMLAARRMQAMLNPGMRQIAEHFAAPTDPAIDSMIMQALPRAIGASGAQLAAPATLGALTSLGGMNQ